MPNPTRRNDVSAPAIRSAPALTYRKRLETGPAPTVDTRRREPTVWPQDPAHLRHQHPHQQAEKPAAPVTDDFRFRRAVERLHKLGPRVVGELLAEVGADLRRVERYADLDRIDPATLHALGADRWPVVVVEVLGP